MRHGAMSDRSADDADAKTIGGGFKRNAEGRRGEGGKKRNGSSFDVERGKEEGRKMRFFAKATIPVEAGNALVKDPNFGKRMNRIISDIKPEAVYFALEGGQRTIYFVINITENSQLPAVAEPLWLSLKAGVEFIPIMDQSDMTEAIPAIQEAARSY